MTKETNIHLEITSYQVVAENDKVSSQPPVLQTKQHQFPQLLLTELVFQTLHQFCTSEYISAAQYLSWGEWHKTEETT